MLLGLSITLFIALIAFYLSRQPFFSQSGISGVIIAIVLGLVMGNTFYSRIAEHCHVGVDFAKQKILRIAIILFGLKLTFNDLIVVGPKAIIIDILLVCLTFAVTFFLGRKYTKMDKDSVILIASGCSICGAAAVLATEPVLRTRTEKVTIAVAIVVIFGTLAMFIYPFMYSYLANQWQISEAVFGVYTGSTVHEVAQVVAVGKTIGEEATNTAVITKMIRVLLLAPFLLILSFWLERQSTEQKQKRGIVIPWFAVGFLIMACINSWPILSKNVTQQIIIIDDILLAMSMAALGLTSHYSVFKKAGIAPLILGGLVFLWLIIGGGLINAVVYSFF